MAGKITSPQEFFGFQMGADRKLARWDKIVQYFNLLAKQSDMIQVSDMGPSTEGNPTLLVVISTPENLKDLERYKEINAKLADPRGVKESEIEAMVQEGKATVVQSGSTHAYEIGGLQMMPEFAYDLLTRTDEEAVRIRENVLSVFIPSLNADGNIMYCDWYEKYLGTEYEGCPLPYLDHKYTGVENVRDAYMLNLVESRYWAKVIFHDWRPQVYQDLHQMGWYGPRLFIAPWAEPMVPNCDPLLWREVAWFGGHMALKLEESGKTGVVNAGYFPVRGLVNDYPILVYLDNVVGLFTETASAKLGTPIYIHPGQITGGMGVVRGFARSGQAQYNYPHPWQGGWWRPRDIVEYDEIEAWAILDLAARNKETVLRNRYIKAKRQIEAGESGRPFAYVIPANQHDPLTVIKLIERLLLLGIETKIARKEFTINNVTYPRGSFIVPMSQPASGMVKTLLGRTFYPDDEWTRTPEGSPIPPWHIASETLGEYMGVTSVAIDAKFDGDFEIIEQAVTPKGKVTGKSETGYVFDGRLNDSYRVANLLLSKGVAVKRVDESFTVGGECFPAGSFMVDAGAENALKSAAAGAGVNCYPLEKKLKVKSHAVKQLRIGMYQRYLGGNMDAGQTEFMFEQFAFPYTNLRDADIRQKDLSKHYDVIVLPDDAAALITGDLKALGALAEKTQRRSVTAFPPEYMSGIGQEGVNSLIKFVKEGGTLLTFNEASNFAIEYFGLPVDNVVGRFVLAGRGDSSVSSEYGGRKASGAGSLEEYFCPGSTLNVNVKNNHPLGYGMPENSLILVMINSPVFNVIPSRLNEKSEIIVRYPDGPDPEKPLLQSGWLIGEKYLYGKAAMVSVKYGEGKVILTGFRHYKATMHGSFKLIFNCLLG